MLPGQHVGVNHDASMMPPASTYKNDQAFFEVKLLVCRWPGHETPGRGGADVGAGGGGGGWSPPAFSKSCVVLVDILNCNY